MSRRLAAIVAIDVVGYSKLVGEDESGTVSALRAVWRNLIEPKAAHYDGRTRKLMGDGALLEFSSVVDATTFAIDVQRSMHKEDVAPHSEPEIVFRIGINLGDIIVDDNDIYGDGVNIAARIEGLAEPGGICLSRSARDQIRDKLKVTLEDLGEVPVKNINRPVRVFKLVLDDGAFALPITDPGQTSASIRPSWRKRSAVALAGIAVLVGALWWQPWQHLTESHDATPTLAPSQKPVVAVLPFQNLSPDGEQEYFVEGLTEALITNLSMQRQLFVIAKGSTQRYRDRDIDPSVAGDELGAGYLVEGSVQRSGGRVRVNAQLVDAQTGQTLWAERFDRDMGDIFAIQDEITGTIAGQLLPEVANAQIKRSQDVPTDNLDAWDLYLRAKHAQSTYTAEEQAEAIRLARLAIAQDKDFAAPYGLLARAMATQVFYQWTDTPDARLKAAIEAARSGIRLDPKDAVAHAALGYVYRLTGDVERSISNLERAAKLNPNNANIRLELAHTLDWFRKQRRALPEIEAAIRLSPRDARMEMMLFYKAHILFHLGEHEASLRAARDMSGVITTDTWQTFYHLIRAANLAMMEKLDEAEEAIARAREIRPNLSLAAIRRRFEGSNNHPDNRAAWLAALRKAGMPEEA